MRASIRKLIKQACAVLVAVYPMYCMSVPDVGNKADDLKTFELGVWTSPASGFNGAAIEFSPNNKGYIFGFGSATPFSWEWIADNEMLIKLYTRAELQTAFFTQEEKRSSGTVRLQREGLVLLKMEGASSRGSSRGFSKDTVNKPVAMLKQLQKLAEKEPQLDYDYTGDWKDFKINKVADDYYLEFIQRKKSLFVKCVNHQAYLEVKFLTELYGLGINITLTPLTSGKLLQINYSKTGQRRDVILKRKAKVTPLSVDYVETKLMVNHYLGKAGKEYNGVLTYPFSATTNVYSEGVVTSLLQLKDLLEGYDTYSAYGRLNLSSEKGLRLYGSIYIAIQKEFSSISLNFNKKLPMTSDNKNKYEAKIKSFVTKTNGEIKVMDFDKVVGISWKTENFKSELLDDFFESIDYYGRMKFNISLSKEVK